MIDNYQFENGLQNGQILISRLNVANSEICENGITLKSPMEILKSWQVWNCIILKDAAFVLYTSNKEREHKNMNKKEKECKRYGLKKLNSQKKYTFKKFTPY
jgi:hypothetical protein